MTDHIKAIKDALEAGRTLATIAFNLSQYTAEPIKPEWAATMRDAYKAWDQAKPAINGLLSRLEEAEREARRYRWLRDNLESDWAICEWSTNDADGIGYYRDARVGHVVDAAIDAAIKEQSK